MASAFRAVDLSVVTATQPYFVFQRLALVSPRAYVLFTIPYGFNYLLRRVVVRWPERNVPALAINPPLFAEVFNTSSQRARQRVPVPITLIASPAGDDITAVAEPAGPLGISMTAAPRQSSKIMNIAFPFGDTIRIEITGQVFAGGVWSPDFVDTVIEGYLVAERSEIGMWGKQGG